MCIRMTYTGLEPTALGTAEAGEDFEQDDDVQEVLNSMHQFDCVHTSSAASLKKNHELNSELCGGVCVVETPGHGQLPYSKKRVRKFLEYLL